MGSVKNVGGPDITGKVGDLIVYKRRDIDRVLVRHKGTLTKDDIRKRPEFESTRKINREFGGRATFSGKILQAIPMMKELSDYNMAGPLNALLRPIQALDTTSEVGKRRLELSKNPSILEGFPMNKRNVFEYVVRTPLKFSLSKEEMKAQIETPALIPHVNFFPVDQYPVFRWKACIAALADMHYAESNGKYRWTGVVKYFAGGNNPKNYEGSWSNCAEGAPGSLIEISLPRFVADGNYSAFLAIGISFGTIRPGGPAAVKYAGCGKIVKGE